MTAASFLLGVAGVVLVAGLGSCLLAASRGDAVARLAALNVAGPLTVLLCLVLSSAFQRSSYVDVALVLAPVSFAGSLVYARFLERWL
jgi:multicomponent Na+:H+ antiporter subunit F